MKKVIVKCKLKNRDEFEKKLRRINYLRVIPSQANYFLVEVLKPYTANELVLKMLKEFNILMRDCSGKEGFDGRQYMRIAVRDSNDNNILIDALKKLER
jgi:histidinol-phosphate/aromatic aminotransferase/cobyric acid decarboxylase-like protein